MNKAMSLLIIIVFTTTVIFTGCGSKIREETKGTDTNNGRATAVNQNTTESGTDIKVSLGQNGNRLSLPDNFPKDIVKLLDDANIINVNDNKESKAVSIVFTTGKSFENVITFYKEVMKDAPIDMENRQQDSYLLSGKKGKNDVMIGITRYNGDNVSVMINVALN